MSLLRAIAAPQEGAAFYRAAFWAVFVFTLIMALLPHPPSLPLPSDKLLHAAAFVTLAVLGALAYPAFGAVRLFAALSAFGALLEVLQAIPALHRDSDPLDWLTDTLAAGGLLIALAAGRTTHRRAQPLKIRFRQTSLALARPAHGARTNVGARQCVEPPSHPRAFQLWGQNARDDDACNN
jgi:hypothetical protein